MINRLSISYKKFSLAIFVLASLVWAMPVRAMEEENAAVSTEQTDTTLSPLEERVALAEAEIAKEEGEEKFDATETIMHHIKDAHDWHLFGDVSIPLPVILYTDKGLEIFSSSNFHHNTQPYTGKYYTYFNHHETIEVVDPSTHEADHEASHHITDLSLTKNAVSMMLSVLALIWIFTSVAKGYTTRKGQAPKGLQSAMEPIILFVRDEIAIPNLGDKYEKFMPYLLTVFFFIWFNNTLGLVPFFPGGANVTGNIAVTMLLALITLVLTNINGTKHYWQHILWMPGIPLPVKLLLTPIEIVGIFTKPIALMIRLFANITAGHILVLSLICLIFIFKSFFVVPAAVPFVAIISLIELLVAFIQAFIFTILTALYIGLALEGGHDEHH